MYFSLDYSCNAQEYRCGDGLCVKKEQLCDGVEHCNDGTDELFCSDTDVGNIGKSNSQ